MRPSILVVEDDAVARTLAGRILKDRYEVEFAADAHEARGKLIGGLVDLLLCDIFLPDENGMDLVETVLAAAGSSRSMRGLTSSSSSRT